MRKLEDSGIEWIGEIPADWTLQRGKTIFAQRLTKGNQSEILLAATQKYGMLPQSEVEGVVQVKEDADLQQFRTVHKKDFVISLRSFQGGFEYSQYEGVCSPAYQVFYNTTPICHDYYRLLFKSDGFIQKMNSMTVGIREGKNIQYSDFANSLIPVPPINQQHRIADYLDRKCSQIDAIIARQQEVIEKLKVYKLSIITEAVTKGLNPDVPMKDSGVEWIGEIPEHWTILKLKYASSILRGKFNHRPRNDPAYYDGNHPFVQTGDVARANKYIKNYSQTLNEKGYAVSKEFPANSICMTIAANVGDVAILTFDACFPDSVVGFVPSDNIAWNYLYYVLTAMKKQFVRNAIISTQLNLNIEIIKEEFIPVAPLHIQEQISKFLDDKSLAIDRTISAKQCVIDKLTDYKKSLIYEVVTGKREV